MVAGLSMRRPSRRNKSHHCSEPAIKASAVCFLWRRKSRRQLQMFPAACHHSKHHPRPWKASDNTASPILKALLPISAPLIDETLSGQGVKKKILTQWTWWNTKHSHDSSPRVAEEERDSLQMAGVGGTVSPQVMPRHLPSPSLSSHTGTR